MAYAHGVSAGAVVVSPDAAKLRDLLTEMARFAVWGLCFRRAGEAVVPLCRVVRFGQLGRFGVEPLCRALRRALAWESFGLRSDARDCAVLRTTLEGGGSAPAPPRYLEPMESQTAVFSFKSVAMGFCAVHRCRRG